MFNTNRKQIIRGQDDFNCVVDIFGHNGIEYTPEDFMTCVFYIYTTDKDVNIECTTANGKLTISANGQYFIQLEASELEILEYGQIRYKFRYEILHNKQPNHTLEGVDWGGADTYLVNEIINN
jgi:hypothetical protein